LCASLQLVSKIRTVALVEHQEIAAAVSGTEVLSDWPASMNDLERVTELEDPPDGDD
jgi:hypothetical protein